MILVSGATGFLGAHMVCRLLQHGHTVKAMHRHSASFDEFDYIYSLYFQDDSARKLLTWAESDVLDIASLSDAFEGVEEVYHCAAMVSFLQKKRSQMFKVNEEGTANMLNMALEKGVSKFCHVSSIAAVGRTKSGEQITEQNRWSDSKLNSNYAVSKYKAEMQAWRAGEEGLPVVIVNPGVIIGAGLWHKGTCKIFDMVWNNMPFYTRGINGYVDVRDVTSAMYLLMQQHKFGQRYLLVGENAENAHIMHTAATHFGKRKAFIEVNRFLSELAWMSSSIASFFTRREPSITREIARASLKKYYYSSEKIIRETGFRFTPLNETLTYICEKYKQSHT